MSNNCRSVCRDKNGKFIKQRRKQWLDNVIKNNKKRKLLRDAEKGFTLRGRRIVELNTLAEELWCKTCDCPLSLRDTIAEERHCLASSLKVRCRICKEKYNVNTCESQISATGAAAYPVNGEIDINHASVSELNSDNEKIENNSKEVKEKDSDEFNDYEYADYDI